MINNFTSFGEGLTQKDDIQYEAAPIRESTFSVDASLQQETVEQMMVRDVTADKTVDGEEIQIEENHPFDNPGYSQGVVEESEYSEYESEEDKLDTVQNQVEDDPDKEEGSVSSSGSGSSGSGSGSGSSSEDNEEEKEADGGVDIFTGTVPGYQAYNPLAGNVNKT